MVRSGLKESWRGLDWRWKITLSACVGCLTLVVFLVVGFLSLALFSSIVDAPERARQIQASNNLKYIRTALEGFAVDNHRRYPPDLQTLIAGFYLDEMPVNPYTKQPTRIIGEGNSIEAGDMVYIPETIEPSSGLSRIYILLIYGPESSSSANKDERLGQHFQELLYNYPWIEADRIIGYYKVGS